MALKVNEPSAERTAMDADLALVTALYGGTRSMRAAGAQYLPQWPNESQDDYVKRLNSSTLFPAYKRTVDTLASRPFTKQVTMQDDVPSALQELAANIDSRGTDLTTFCKSWFRAALGDGFAGILVEHPKRPANARTQADDERMNMRPYFVLLRLQQILGWRSEVFGGKVKLTQLRFIEQVEEPDGEFGTAMVEQVRVLELGSWRTFRRATSGAAKGTFVLHEEGVTTPITDSIPFVPLYGEQTSFMTSRPPLRELAHLNVKHWQSQSDQDNLLHVARVPILWHRGTPDSFKLVIGGNTAVNLGDNPNAELNYAEHSGSSIGAGKTALDDLKDEMRQAGAELLVLKPGAATATEVASDNAVGLSALQEMALAAEGALNIAMSYAAQFIGLGAGKGGTSTVYRDFGAATLAEASASLLVGMATAGKLSGETLFNELKRRGIVADDVKWSEEQERIEAEGPPPGSEPDVELDENGDPIDPMNQQRKPSIPPRKMSGAGNNGGKAAE